MKTAFILLFASTAMSAAAALMMMQYLRGGKGCRAHGALFTAGPAPSHLTSCAENPEPCAMFERCTARLEREIAALTRRGNLNLTIGVITTGLAVGLLAYMVMNEDSVAGDLASVVSHYVPRAGTVLFIEIFSYFFLRLYRASLAEIKFYQNELTALASQQIALDASRAVGPAATQTVIDQISRHNPNALPAAPAAPSNGPPAPAASPEVKLALDVVDRMTALASGAGSWSA